LGGVETTMRALRVLFAAAIAALSIVVVGAGPSFACSCVMADTATHVEWADVVLTGTLAERTPPEQTRVMSSMDPATYVVDVDQVFKGEAGPRVEILSPNSGASCGLELVAEHKRYVFFAGHESMEGKDQDHLWANLCGGTGPATPKLVGAVAEATGDVAAPDGPNGTAYESELTLTLADSSEHEPADDDVLADWALPIGLVAGGSLVLLTSVLWVRHALR
jgi:hypothetical protein